MAERLTASGGWLPEDIERYELRECQLCGALIANSRSFGRLPHRMLKEGDPNVCEACDWPQKEAQR